MTKDFYQHLTEEELATEVWEPVVNYEKQYEVSNLGRIRRKRTQRILKLFENNRGYLQVSLCKDGFAKSYLVHKIVLESFNGPRPENKESDHISRDRQDNRLENLHWVTHSENNRNRNSNKKIIQYTLSGNKIQEFDTIADAVDYLIDNKIGNNYNTVFSTISHCARGHIPTAYHFTWGYERELNGKAKHIFLKAIKETEKNKNK